MRTQTGLTLLETLMGLAVLAISVLALVLLQQTTFNADSVSASSRTAQRLAENELAAQLATPTAAAGPCITQGDITEGHASTYSCETRVFNCGVLTTPNIRLDCSATAPNPPTHQLITVTISSPRAHDLTLNTVRARN